MIFSELNGWGFHSPWNKHKTLPGWTILFECGWSGAGGAGENATSDIAIKFRSAVADGRINPRKFDTARERQGKKKPQELVPRLLYNQKFSAAYSCGRNYGTCYNVSQPGIVSQHIHKTYQ